MLSKRSSKILHELTNHLAAVDGYLDIEKPKQARLELKKAIISLHDLRVALRAEPAIANEQSA